MTPQRFSQAKSRLISRTMSFAMTATAARLEDRRCQKSAVEALDARIDTLELATIQQIATDRLLGRDTAGTGDVEQLTVGGGIEFTTSRRHSALGADWRQ